MKRALESATIALLALLGVVLGLRIADRNLPTTARAQTSARLGAGYKKLTVVSGLPMSPVEIAKVTVGAKEMDLSASASVAQQEPSRIFDRIPFQADPNWLSETTIYVRNRSDKTIAWMNVLLLFPDTESGRAGNPISALPVGLGEWPAVDISTIRTANGQPPRVPANAKPLNLKPGREIAVQVADYITRIKSLLGSALPPSSVSQLEVHVSNLYFDDGMRWGGYYSVPDTAHPGQMIDMPEDYFPGNPHHYQ